MEKKPRKVRNLTALISCPGVVNAGRVENDDRMSGDSPRRASGRDRDSVG
jgi:hypothetical protein